MNCHLRTDCGFGWTGCDYRSSPDFSWWLRLIHEAYPRIQRESPRDSGDLVIRQQASLSTPRLSEKSSRDWNTPYPLQGQKRILDSHWGIFDFSDSLPQWSGSNLCVQWAAKKAFLLIAFPCFLWSRLRSTNSWNNWLSKCNLSVRW